MEWQRRFFFRFFDNEKYEAAKGLQKDKIARLPNTRNQHSWSVLIIPPARYVYSHRRTRDHANASRVILIPEHRWQAVQCVSGRCFVLSLCRHHLDLWWEFESRSSRWKRSRGIFSIGRSFETRSNPRKKKNFCQKFWRRSLSKMFDFWRNFWRGGNSLRLDWFATIRGL